MPTEKRSKFSSIRLAVLLVCAFVVLGLAIAGCGNEVVEPTEVPPTEAPEPTPLPDQTAYHDALASSIHGNTYGLGKGPNTWCSRCHSPLNWDPASYPGDDPNCIACKFPFDEAVREVESMDFVPEEEWVNITCENCHELENEVSTGEFAWLDVQTMTYREVNTSTELCEMCHNDPPTFKGGGTKVNQVTSHRIEVLGSAHSQVGFIQDARPQYCADCHDPHNLEPKTCEACHDVASIDTHILGKNFHLGFVTCMACHDASGLDVGIHPDEDNDMWVTSETTVGRGGPSTSVVISHSIQRSVTCDRCHFEGNPNGLTEYTAEGEIPEVDICKDGEILSVPKPDLDEYGELGIDYTIGGACPPEVDICKDGETLTVPKPDLDEYGELDVDYTMAACPTEEGGGGGPP